VIEVWLSEAIVVLLLPAPTCGVGWVGRPAGGASARATAAPRSSWPATRTSGRGSFLRIRATVVLVPSARAASRCCTAWWPTGSSWSARWPKSGLSRSKASSAWTVASAHCRLRMPSASAGWSRVGGAAHGRLLWVVRGWARLAWPGTWPRPPPARGATRRADEPAGCGGVGLGVASFLGWGCVRPPPGRRAAKHRGGQARCGWCAGVAGAGGPGRPGGQRRGCGGLAGFVGEEAAAVGGLEEAGFDLAGVQRAGGDEVVEVAGGLPQQVVALPGLAGRGRAVATRPSSLASAARAQGCPGPAGTATGVAGTARSWARSASRACSAPGSDGRGWVRSRAQA
jgi:hypothetical protein